MKLLFENWRKYLKEEEDDSYESKITNLILSGDEAVIDQVIALVNALPAGDLNPHNLINRFESKIANIILSDDEAKVNQAIALVNALPAGSLNMYDLMEMLFKDKYAFLHHENRNKNLLKFIKSTAPRYNSLKDPALKEENSYRNRIKSYIKDRDKMLGQGGQKNTPPFTGDLGKHVTFDKQTDNIDESAEEDIEQLEENDEDDSFQN